jgi:hypothetical protein
MIVQFITLAGAEAHSFEPSRALAGIPAKTWPFGRERRDFGVAAVRN